MSFSISQYREIRPASAEKLKDGRKRLTRYVSFKQNSEFPGDMGGTIGSSTDAATNFSSPPTGWENLYLVSAVTDASLSPNASGNNPVVVLTYEQAGTVSQTDETRNNGALLIRTITSAHTAPSTPSGYTLIRAEDNNPSGFDTFTYTFAKGDGEIGRTIDYRQSSDQGTTGATVTTIRYLVADEGTVMPTSLSGSVEIGRDYADQDGHRIWTTTWAKGTGTVATSKQIRSLGKLHIYSITALGSAPSAPAAELGGTVTLFDTNVRNVEGYNVYEYRWAEAEVDGRTGLSTTMRPDGSLVYTLTELNSVADTPAYPGSGTGYLVDLDQNRADGHYVNRAVYIKAPATVTLNKVVQFQMPGTASFTTSPKALVVSPPSTRTLLASVEVSYNTTQLSDTPFKVDYGCFYTASYVRTGSGVGEYISKSLGYVVGGSDSVSGTAANYNGVSCVSFDAVISSSSPTSRPTGATVLDVDNDVYLTAIDGTVVYRRTKTSYTF